MASAGNCPCGSRCTAGPHCAVLSYVSRSQAGWPLLGHQIVGRSGQTHMLAAGPSAALAPPRLSDLGDSYSLVLRGRRLGPCVEYGSRPPLFGKRNMACYEGLLNDDGGP